MSENIQKSPLPCGGGLGVGETQSIKQGYKQTSLGILPQEWEVVRLGEVCFVQSGGTPPKNEKSYWENGTIKWLGSSVCKNLHYIDEITDFITEKGLQNSSAKIFKQGTTLIALVGATIGKVAFLNFEATTNQNIAGIYPQDEKKLNQTFLFYISLMLHKEFIRLSSDKFKMANLSFIKSLQIPLPPLAEQEKIAQILGVWDKGISVLKSLIEAKTKHKKALMQRLLTPPCESPTPSLRASETSAAIHNKSVDCHDLTASNLAKTEKDSKAKQSLRFAEFTDKWQEMRLGDICEIKKGEQLNKLSLSNNSKGKFAVINGGILPSGYTDKFNTNENTITISEGGNSCGFVNFIKEKFWSGGHCYTIINSKASVLYLYYFLKFKETFIQELRVGSGLPNIQKKDIENFKVSFPTLAEQKKIAQVLSACDKEIELLKSKFQCLKTQKKGLMQRLLNGKVRVKC